MQEDDIRTASLRSQTRLLPGQEARGEDMGRILALSDGVFAFAMTLLVLTLTVPTIVTQGVPPNVVSGHLGFALWKDYGAFAGYVFVFVMIGYWWLGHHRIFRYIVRYDDTLVSLNLALLLEIAVMPFVLRVWITYDQTQVAVILFSLIQIAASMTLGTIWRYASWKGRLIPKGMPEATIRYFGVRTLIAPIAFFISIGVSFISVTGAEYVWVTVFVAQGLTRVLFSRRVREMAPSVSAP